MSIEVAFSDHTSLRLPVAFARQLPGHAKKATAVVLSDLRKSFFVEVGWAGQLPRLYHIFSSGWSKVVQAGAFREGDTLRVEYVPNLGTYYVSKVSSAAAGGVLDPIGACARCLWLVPCSSSRSQRVMLQGRPAQRQGPQQISRCA